ncbi:MAG: hypothetical protein R6W84_00485 [Promethearchaeia archaeon]
MNYLKIILSTFVLFMITFFTIVRNPSPKKEYKVNEYIKLKLENGVTNIYVKNQRFRQCMYLLLNIPMDKIRDYEDIDSIDKAAEHLDRSMEGNRVGQHGITPEVEFWGHCSNITAWAENGYDTRILHRNLAFPLLKRLVEVGDPEAKKVFKEEIALRLASNHPTVINYLIQENYLRHLSSDELESIMDDLSLSFLDNFVRNLNTYFNQPQRYSNQYLFSLFQGILNNFNIKHIPLIFSKIKQRIPDDKQNELALLLYNHYKKNSTFPKIKFINNNIDAFNLEEFELIKYKSRIIGMLDDDKLFLNDKKIVDIDCIEGIEDSISTIIELDLSNNLITDLKGIEKYINLKILRLDNNMIEDITNINNITSVEDLSLRNNKICDLKNIEGLVNLKRLNLSGNKTLKKIPETLAQLPNLRILKVWNCDIRVYEEATNELFWNDQNYCYFTGFTQKAVDYYEETHKSKARSRSDDRLYKDFTKWVIKMNKLMKKNKITYDEIEDFEEIYNSNAIWGGKITNKFKYWLFNKDQTKITDFF